MLDIILALDRCFKLTFQYYRNRNHITPFRNRPSGIYILTGVSEKNVLGLGNFPPGCPCHVTVLLCLFKYTQMMYAWYLKVVPGKPQTGPVKLKISPVTGEGKRVNLKNPPGRSCQWICHSEGCYNELYCNNGSLSFDQCHAKILEFEWQRSRTC